MGLLSPTQITSSIRGGCSSKHQQAGRKGQRGEAYLEEVAGQEVCGSAGGFQEGFPGDGHAHRGKLGEVVNQAVHTLQQAAG